MENVDVVPQIPVMDSASSDHKTPNMNPNMMAQNTVVKNRQCRVCTLKQIMTRNRFHVLHTIAEDSDEEEEPVQDGSLAHGHWWKVLEEWETPKQHLPRSGNNTTKHKRSYAEAVSPGPTASNTHNREKQPTDPPTNICRRWQRLSSLIEVVPEGINKCDEQE